MVRPMWCADSAGLVSTSMGTLKLIVRKSDSYARYVILHSAVGAARSENILSSGSEANVQAAIEAAEKVATRIGLILASRGRSDISRGRSMIRRPETSKQRLT